MKKQRSPLCSCGRGPKRPNRNNCLACNRDAGRKYLDNRLAREKERKHRRKKLIAMAKSYAQQPRPEIQPPPGAKAVP